MGISNNNRQQTRMLSQVSLTNPSNNKKTTHGGGEVALTDLEGGGSQGTGGGR